MEGRREGGQETPSRFDPPKPPRTPPPPSPLLLLLLLLLPLLLLLLLSSWDWKHHRSLAAVTFSSLSPYAARTASTRSQKRKGRFLPVSHSTEHPDGCEPEREAHQAEARRCRNPLLPFTKIVDYTGHGPTRTGYGGLSASRWDILHHLPELCSYITHHHQPVAFNRLRALLALSVL